MRARAVFLDFGRAGVSPAPRATVALALAASLLAACPGQDQPVGRIEGGPRALAPAPEGARDGRQILFGDLHAHTTFSVDAFLYALPIFAGEGAHPPADACDFARHCSALDFFSINDHAEGLTPARWDATIESIRACNERAPDPESPDLVAFLGWEWTQVGATPEEHYGHKNVIFPGLADDEIPARPISSLTARDFEGRPPPGLLTVAERALWRPYSDFAWWVDQLNTLENCGDAPVRELPRDCRENAATPAELFAKLDDWGLPFLVIPHGIAWGVHAPPGARLDNQLAPGQHDPGKQRLLEVYSGHGNGERYVEALEREPASAKDAVCPAPTAEVLPCCWRAGEIMRERCGDLPEAECEARVREARRLALEAGVAPHLVFPDTRAADWLDCDQCRDCFKPVFTPRPGESAQYALALARAEAAPGEPRQLRMGFIASSDDHHARPGTGYKQLRRKGMSDARGFASPRVEGLLRRAAGRGDADPREPQPVERRARSFGALLDVERTASFLYPGGLVAAHAAGRSRGAVWDALQRREVYGTSGPRILLWFDLVNAPGGPAPMGSEVVLDAAPRFRVRAVGAREQLPGCPEEARRALSAERLERLCFGECFHPGDRRHRIETIEVVRVRAASPGVGGGEGVAGRIDDPWRTLPCPAEGEGCEVEFEDPSPAAAGAVYYVRALQEPTPAVNGATLRTRLDGDGRATAVEPCYGDWRTDPTDDCLAPVRERAWSSPIWVDTP